MIDPSFLTGNKKMDDKIKNALVRDSTRKDVALMDWVADTQNPNKYHISREEKRQKDNMTFASKDEKDDYTDLRYRQKAGEIFDLKLQVPIEIIPGFMHQKMQYKGVYYVADAMYRGKDGRVYIQDTKGFATKEYKIKKKLVMYFHPEYVFVESHRKDYSDL